MKQKFLILFAITAMAFGGCGSGTKDQNNDSLMTDSTVVDTADMGASPADTSAMRTDTLSKDTGSVAH